MENTQEQPKVKNISDLRKEHEVYKLNCEIAEFRARTALANARYLEVVMKFNQQPNPETAKHESMADEAYATTQTSEV